MKKILIFFIFLFLTRVSALEFSPPSLQFDLQTDQQTCKSIFLKLDSEATLSDSWAQNPSQEWSVTNFRTSHQQLQIQVSYPQTISSSQQEVQVCISGANTGDYKGALIFNQEKVGNSIVQFVVWLKVSISGTTQQPTQEQTKKSSSSGGNRGIVEYSIIENTKPLQEVQPLSFETPQEKIKLSNRAKKTNQQINSLPIILMSTTALMFLILFLLIITNRKA